MSNSRNLADLLDANGDVKATSLDNTSLGGLTDATTTATSNLGLGTGAVDSITTGDYNVGVGDSALTAATSCSSNTAVGHITLENNTTGENNTAIGYAALRLNTTAHYNSAFGMEALRFNTTGANNTANGYQALYSNTTGAYNTVIGRTALYSNTTGANNTALGYAAGDNITTGSSNIIIGYNVDAPSATASNQLNIGNWITGAAGAITVPGSLTTAGFTSTGIDDNATSTAITLPSTGKIVIDTAAPIDTLTLKRDAGVNGTATFGFPAAGLEIDSSTALKFSVDGNEKGRFLSGGGLTFNGDTAAANALDDYEEGTWTAVLSDGTNNATMVAGTQSYVKIGKQVTLNGYMQTSSLGSVSGNIRITGLPFTTGKHASSGVGLALNLEKTAGHSVGLFCDPNNTHITPTLSDTAIGTSHITSTEWSADGFIAFSFIY